MSPRHKQQLYHSLAQLLRAGLSFPHALDKLAVTTRGDVRRRVTSIRQSLAQGRTVAEACIAADIGSTEAAVLTAVERAGSLDRGLEQLSHYFGAVAAARGKVIAKLVYPVFVLVLGVLLLNLPVVVREGATAYFRTTVPLLGGCVLGAALLVFVAKFIGAVATFNPAVDALIRLIPMIGGMQRAFAMSRFCLTYELQLDAGINVINALQAAGAASRSGLVRSAVAKVVPRVREGLQVGPQLAQYGAFHPDVAQGIIVGEESGTLSTELRRLTETESARAFGRLEAFAEWLPRLIYLGVVGYVGWTIIAVYRDYLGQVQRLIDS